MTLIMHILRSIGADPGFQVREAHLKKLRQAEGSAPGTSIQKLINIDRRKLVEILVLILKK